MHRDWAIYLGAGAGTVSATAPYYPAYPAQFSANYTTPTCSDFIVFPINAVGGTTQPNIVALNNLYSGTAGANGFCNRTASGSDTGVAATVLWSYNVHAVAAGGAVPTSPVLSMDGTKVAFVESAANNPAQFHVLAPNAKDGQNSSDLQSVASPLPITTFVLNAPAASSGTATDLALGTSTSGTDTNSSPFVDYVRDQAYVGNDTGVLYRINNVFCTMSNCANAQPTLDPHWGTSGAVTVCSGKLTGPVMDFVTLNVFVGCADGKLYAISSTGTVLTSIVVGDGTSETYGGVVDPPIVDGVNGFVYAVSGSANSGAYGALVQATTTLSGRMVAQIGSGNQCNMHAPTPNNAYFTSITSATALMYVAGVTGTVSQPCLPNSTGTGGIEMYAVTFNTTTGVMKSGTPAHSFEGGTPGNEWAPLFEFYNTTTAVDWIIAGVLCNPPPNMASANITSGFPNGFGLTASEGLGTSGMVVDNSANTTTYPQASSFYFNSLLQNQTCNNVATEADTGGCAVKLTQAALE